MSKLSPRAAGFACLLVTSIGWGLNWPAMKFLLQEWPPLFARGSAGLCAAALIACMAMRTGQAMRVPRAAVGRLALAGFFNVFAWMGFSTLALQWLHAGQAALLVYTMPVWATLLAWPVLGKRPTLRGLAGLLLCLVGIFLLFSGGPGSAGGIGMEAWPGVLFALAAAVLFAFGTVVLKPPAIAPLVSVAWQLAAGCLPMVVYGLAVERPDFSALTARGAVLMLYMTLVPMGLCYISWFAALRRLPPASASVATLLTPVVGVLAAAVSLGEPLGGRELGAMTLALSGVALALTASARA